WALRGFRPRAGLGSCRKVGLAIWRFHARKAGMLDHSSKTLLPGDPLTEMLRGLRLEGVQYDRCRLAVPWGVGFAAEAGARFHFVSQSGCWLRVPPGEWLELGQGDAVLLPRGVAH